MTLPELGSSLPEVALRTAIIYVVVVALLRFGGKREVGQMSILDLVVVLVIADGVQNSMVGENTSLYGGIVAAITLVGVDRAIKTLTNRYRRVGRLLEGEPTLLVHDGRVLTGAMKRQSVSHADLMAALRAHGVENPAQVRLAVLETSGSISVVPRESPKPSAPSL